MAKFQINWQKTEYCTSEIIAKDLVEAQKNAEESVTDFGDPDQVEFSPEVDWGWEVESIEEIE